MTEQLSLYAGDSLEMVVDLYGKMIYRLAYAKTSNIHDAEDIMQEVFLRYAKIGKEGKIFENEEHRKAWLLRVTVNCSKTAMNLSWHRRRSDEQLDENMTACGSEIKKTDNKLSVREALASLPEKYRVIVHLYYYEELSVSEIGDIAGISENTVRTRLHRAKEKLRKILKGVDFND